MHHAVEGRRLQLRSASARCRHADDLDVRRSSSSCATLSRWRASSSTTSTRRTLCASFASSALERLDQLLALDRLERVADGAHARSASCGEVVDRDHVHRDVPRRGLRLSWSSTPRPEWSGRLMSSRIASGGTASRAARPSFGRVRHHAVEAAARARGRAGSRRSARRPRRPGRGATAGVSWSRSSSIGSAGARGWRAGARRRPPGRLGPAAQDGGAALASAAPAAARARRRTARQRQREGAALAGRAGHRDVAAEQARQVARDRQAQPGAAVACGGAAVGLAEGLEDERPAGRGGMPMPVSLTAKATPSVGRAATRSVTSPRSVNLSALDSRFFRICSSRWRSVNMRAGRSGLDRRRRS